MKEKKNAYIAGLGPRQVRVQDKSETIEKRLETGLEYYSPNFDAAKFSIKQFSFIYFIVSVVRQQNEYEKVIETRPIKTT